MRIKNRAVALRRIEVPYGDGIGTIRCIHVTDAQLARLNRIPIGREIFRSNFYCHIGGDFGDAEQPKRAEQFDRLCAEIRKSWT
jgi:hypothetical protein